MRIVKFLPAFLAILFTFFSTNSAKASHALGFDITYECVGPNTYNFSVAFYRDCQGISAPGTVTLEYFAPACGVTNTQTLTLNQGAGCTNALGQSAGQEVSDICSSQLGNTACSGGSQYPGVEVYVYCGTLTLPSECSEWIVGYGICCRNDDITNLQNANTFDGYGNVTINNTAPICNNSPSFTNNPSEFICAGFPTTYNQETVDPDGDSLVFTIVQSLDDFGVPIPYNPPFTTNQPFSTVGSFNFDPTTGTMTFTPDVPQNAVVTVLVEEYRIINGVPTLVGSTLRDIQFTILDGSFCNSAVPSDPEPQNVIGGGLIDSASLQVCPGSTVCFDLISIDPVGNILTITANDLTSLPGATISVTGSGTNDTVIANICWTPTLADVGQNFFNVVVANDACPVPSSITQTIKVFVFDDVVVASSAPAFCGDSIQLTAFGGTTFTWIPPAGLSDPAIFDPLAAPAVPTMYSVFSECGSDSILVGVAPPFNLDAGEDTTICLNEITQLNPVTAATIGSWDWSPSTGLNDATIRNPLSGPTNSVEYIVTAISDSGCLKQDTINVFVDGIGPQVFIDPSLAEVCPGDTVSFATTIIPLTCGASFGAGSCGPGNPPVPKAYPATPGAIASPTTPFMGADNYGHYQVLYRATDLNAAGITGGTITRLQFNVSTKRSTGFYNDFSIKIGCTGDNVLSRSTWQGASTEVYFSAQQLINAGPNAFAFSAPYDWDGISNLVIEVCFGDGTGNAGGNDDIEAFSAGYGASMGAPSNFALGNSGCNIPVSAVPLNEPSLNAPNISFFICDQVVPTYTYQWSSGGATILNPTDPNTSAIVDTSATTVTVNVSDGQCEGSDFADVIIGTPVLNISSDTVLCNADSVQLFVEAFTNGAAPCGIANTICTGPDDTYILGTGTTQNANFSYPAPYGNFFESVQQQYIYRAGDIAASGATPGKINTLSFFINSVPAGASFFYRNFSISMKCTSSSELIPGEVESGTAVVYSRAVEDIRNPSGANVNYWLTHTLDAPFDWDGVSNIIIEICFNNDTGPAFNDFTQNAISSSTTTSYISSSWRPVDQNDACNGAVSAADAGGTTLRPNVLMNICPTGQISSVTWSNGATLTDPNIVNPIAFPSTTTTYTVTVASTSGCESTAEVTVGLGSLVYGLTNDTVICFGDSVDLGVLGGDYQVSWTPSATLTSSTGTPVEAFPSTTTTYYVTIIDTTQGCVVNDSVTVSVVVPMVDLGNDTILCIDETVTLTADSVSGFTYEWQDGSTNASFVVSAAGTYSVTVSGGGAACEVTDTVVVDYFPATPVDLGNDTTTCNRALITFDAGPGYVDYNWNTGDNTQTITTGDPRTIIVAATDTNGCVNRDTLILADAGPSLDLGQDTILCVGDSITFTVVDTFTSILWEPGSIADTNSYTVDTTVTIIVSAVDSVSCGASDTVNVQFNPLPIVDLGNDTILCPQACVTLDAGNPGLNYFWSTGATTQTIVACAAGDYNVVVFDSAGCGSSDTLTVTILPSTPVDLGPDLSACIGDFATLDAGAAYVSYAWSTTETTQTIDVNTTGSYWVCATDTIGCETCDTINVDFSAPTVSLSDQQICAGQSITLDAGAGFTTYNWTPNGETTQTITVNSAGIYGVVVTNATGCSGSDSATVTELPGQFVNITSPSDSVCAGDSITLTASNGFNSYNWSPTGDTTQSITVPAGTYSVSVVGQCSGDTSITIGTYTPIVVTIVPGDTTLCANGSAMLTTADAYVAYDWSTTDQTAVTTVTESGTYTVDVIDANGCNGSGSTTVAVSDFAVDAIASPSTINNGESTSLDAIESNGTGPYTYVWTPATSLDDPTLASPTATPTDTTVYYVTITDTETGCETIDSVTVIVISEVSINFPEAFTPNGDGSNEEFFVITSGNTRLTKFRIVNRWGELVHEDPTVGWNGVYDGDPQPTGSYIYEAIIEYDTVDGIVTEEIQGVFTLLR